MTDITDRLLRERDEHRDLLREALPVVHEVARKSHPVRFDLLDLAAKIERALAPGYTGEQS